MGGDTGVLEMDGISDIKIIGLDELRPPMIRDKPYIDLFFKLSHKAPEDWCKDFNALLSKHPTKPRIKEKEGLFIDAWVKSPDDIEKFLDQLEGKIADCSKEYVKRIELSIINASKNGASLSGEETGEQGRLNKIIAGLVFGKV
jgi:hypothetical protein